MELGPDNILLTDDTAGMLARYLQVLPEYAEWWDGRGCL